MRQFLIQVDGPRDIRPFKKAIDEAGLSWSDIYDDAWTAPLIQQSPRLADAEFFIVHAESAEAIWGAVDAAARLRGGSTRASYSIRGQQEPPTYPA